MQQCKLRCLWSYLLEWTFVWMYMDMEDVLYQYGLVGIHCECVGISSVTSVLRSISVHSLAGDVIRLCPRQSYGMMSILKAWLAV